MVFGYKLIE